MVHYVIKGTGIANEVSVMLSDEIVFSFDEFSEVHVVAVKPMRDSFIVIRELLCRSAKASKD